jgi:hypothetical protein
VKIQEFKLQPKLIEVVLDGEDIVRDYGEAITFWMYDHLDLTTYFQFVRAQSEAKTDELLQIIKSILRDENGNTVMDPDDQLPVDIFAEAVIAISRHLGKSKTKNSSPAETGTQP